MTARPRPRIGITSANGAGANGLRVMVNRPYVDAVLAAGGLPIVLPVLDPAAAGEVLATIDGLLLTGGGDVDPATYGQDAGPEVEYVDPDRDAWELALFAAAGSATPVLAVCRGAQVANVGAGGTLVQHLGEEHRVGDRRDEAVHPVDVAEGSRLRAIGGAAVLEVNSLHHQAVDDLGAGLVVTATAADGTIEAFEAADHRPLVAVQWHPELLTTSVPDAALFRWLVETSERDGVSARRP